MEKENLRVVHEEKDLGVMMHDMLSSEKDKQIVWRNLQDDATMRVSFNFMD